jgi:uncharacterized coiled-coil DUF342 family protein
MRAAITAIAAILVLTACDTDRHPSYEELKSENDQLQAQLAETHEKIEQAKSELDDLRSEIRSVEDEPCHEDSAGDLGTKADDVDSALDEAEEESN